MKFLSSILVGLVLVSAVAKPLVAAPGDIDPTFNVVPQVAGTVRVVVKQPDGKFLVAGDFSKISGVARRNMARIHADGSVDLSFDVGVGFDLAYTTGVHTICLQDDGKILVGGFFHTFNGEPVSNLMRFEANGTRDLSFRTVTFKRPVMIDSSVDAIAIQADGKILIGGSPMVAPWCQETSPAWEGLMVWAHRVMEL